MRHVSMTVLSQGPTNTYQDADRLLQQQQQQQLQQQCAIDVDGVRGGAASSPQAAAALAEPVPGPATSPASQDPTGLFLTLLHSTCILMKSSCCLHCAVSCSRPCVVACASVQ